jgi:hypothetical protein
VAAVIILLTAKNHRYEEQQIQPDLLFQEAKEVLFGERVTALHAHQHGL